MQAPKTRQNSRKVAEAAVKLRKDKMRMMEFPKVYVQNFSEKEEATCIDTAILIQSHDFKKYVAVSLLSILSAFIFPIFLYW